MDLSDERVLKVCRRGSGAVTWIPPGCAAGLVAGNSGGWL